MDIQIGAVALFLGGQTSIIIAEWFRGWNTARNLREERFWQRRADAIQAFRHAVLDTWGMMLDYARMRYSWDVSHPGALVPNDLQAEYIFPVLRSILRLNDAALSARLKSISDAYTQFDAAAHEFTSSAARTRKELDRLDAAVRLGLNAMLIAAEQASRNVEGKSSIFRTPIEDPAPLPSVTSVPPASSAKDSDAAV